MAEESVRAYAAMPASGESATVISKDRELFPAPWPMGRDERASQRGEGHWALPCCDGTGGGSKDSWGEGDTVGKQSVADCEMAVEWLGRFDWS